MKISSLSAENWLGIDLVYPFLPFSVAWKTPSPLIYTETTDPIRTASENFIFLVYFIKNIYNQSGIGISII